MIDIKEIKKTLDQATKDIAPALENSLKSKMSKTKIKLSNGTFYKEDISGVFSYQNDTYLIVGGVKVIVNETREQLEKLL